MTNIFKHHSIGYILGIFAVASVLYFQPDLFTKTIKINNIIEDQQYELSFVRDDLNTYEYTSKKVQQIITQAIDSASLKYNIPIGLLHSVLRVESDYKLDAIHNQITVKGKITRAKGIGGIVWEYWSEQLIEEGIAEQPMDLILPDVNIHASAFILRWLINDEFSRNKNLSRANFLSNVVRRYYGAYDQGYLSKMEKYTSDLWMKRMSALLLNDLYQTEEEKKSNQKFWQADTSLGE